MYSRRSRDSNFDNRARQPTKGLRLRLRTLLRANGVTGKFRTDELRRFSTTTTTSLVVIGNPSNRDLTEFEGHPVLYRSIDCDKPTNIVVINGKKST